MVQPVKKVRNVHKRTKRFTRHQSDRFDRLKPNWRRPKGLCVASSSQRRGRAASTPSFHHAARTQPPHPEQAVRTRPPLTLSLAAV